MAAPYNAYKIIRSELGCNYRYFMSHFMTSRVIPSATRLLVLLESFIGVPDRQVNILGGRGPNGIILSSSSARLAQ